MIRFIDIKCPKCGLILEDIEMRDFENNKKAYKCQNGHTPTSMVKVIPTSKFRMIKYSPEYKGGSDRHLINQPQELMER
jgi:hypothetical protein